MNYSSGLVIALISIFLFSPIFGQTAGSNSGDGIADGVVPFEENLIPGIEKEVIKGSPATAQAGSTAQEAQVVAPNAPPERPSKGWYESLKEKFGSDRTIINIIVLMAIFIIFAYYRMKSGKKNRSN